MQRIQYCRSNAKKAVLHRREKQKGMGRPKVRNAKRAANALHHAALGEVLDRGRGKPLMTECAFAIGSRGAVVDSKRPIIELKLEHSGEEAPRGAYELMASQQTATASVLSIVSTNNNSYATTEKRKRAKGNSGGEK